MRGAPTRVDLTRRAGLRSPGLRATRGAPTRADLTRRTEVAPYLPDEFRHLERRLGGLLAAVPDLATGARPRLLLAEGADDAEGDRHAGRQRDVADARRRLAHDVLEVRRLSTDHRAHARDAGVAARGRQVAGGLRQLEGARDPVDLHGVVRDPGPAKRAEGPLHQPLGDALVEPRRDDREAQR